MKNPGRPYEIIQKIEATGGSTIENVTQQVIVERAKLERVFLVPPLPPHFIARPEVSAPLKERLLTADANSGTLAISAVHGLGGIGKSTLAVALAHDAEVQERFKHGVLWVTLGQNPDILSLLSGWIQALGDYDFHPTTPEAASAHLRALLVDRAALILIDDAWDAQQHIAPFLVGGPQCFVLITTRRADVVQEVGAELVLLDTLTEEQSLTLLAKRLRRELRQDEIASAQRLAKAVGYLPMAIEQAAARLSRDVAWEQFVSDLEAEIGRLGALHGPRQARLEASLNLSLNALKAFDQAAWEGFAWLGVFPEDAALAAPQCAVLWKTILTEADKRLELLWNDALLLPAAPVFIGDKEFRAYRLHDLLRDIARGILTNSRDGLNVELAQAHKSLLRSYADQVDADSWHLLKDDGYIHSRLAWHLEQAGWEDELHRLICKQGTPHLWYQTREKLGQIGGFIEDLSRGWALAEKNTLKQLSESQAVTSFGLEIRYALMAASILNLAGNLPPNLVHQLVENRVWGQAQGLSYARAIHNPIEKVLVLVALLPCLDSVHQPAAQAEVMSALGRVTSSDIVLAYNPQLGPFLVQQFGSPERAGITPTGEKALFLLQVSKGLLSPDKELVHRSGFDILMELLRTDGYRSPDYLSKVLPLLQPPELELVLTEARKPINFARLISIGEQNDARFNQVAIELEIVARLAGQKKEDGVFENLFGALERMVDKPSGWNAETNRCMRRSVQALASVLPENKLPRVAAMIEKHRFTDELSEAFVWGCLAGASTTELQDSSIDRMLSSLRRFSGPLLFSGVKESLLEALPVVARLGYYNEALEVARKAYDPLSAEVVSVLAPAMPQPARRSLLQQELTAIVSTGSVAADWESIADWMRLAPLGFDKDRVIEEALTRAERNPTRESSFDSVSHLIPLMALSQLERAMSLALKRSASGRSFALIQCAKGFARLNQPQRAISVVLTFDLREQSSALADVIPHLTDARTLEWLAERSGEYLRDTRYRSYAEALSIRLAELGEPHKSFAIIENLIDTWLQDINANYDGPIQALISRFDRIGSGEVARRIQTKISHYGSPANRAAYVLHMLEQENPTGKFSLPRLENLPLAAQSSPQLAPRHLDTREVEERLQGIRQLKQDERHKTQLLLWLAEETSRSDLPKLLDEADLISDRYASARALTRLCKHLDGTELVVGLRRALEAAAKLYNGAGGIEDEAPDFLDPSWQRYGGERRQVLGEALMSMERLTPSVSLGLFQELLHSLIYRGRSELLDDLATVRPHLMELFGPALVGEVIDAIVDVTSWWP